MIPYEGSRRKRLETFAGGSALNAEGPTFRPTLPVKARAVGTYRTSPVQSEIRTFLRENQHLGDA
jgi:hypothetical protein